MVGDCINEVKFQSLREYFYSAFGGIKDPALCPRDIPYYRNGVVELWELKLEITFLFSTMLMLNFYMIYCGDEDNNKESWGLSDISV